MPEVSGITEWARLSVAGGALIAVNIVVKTFCQLITRQWAEHERVVCNHLEHVSASNVRLAEAVEGLKNLLAEMKGEINGAATIGRKRRN